MVAVILMLPGSMPTAAAEGEPAFLGVVVQSIDHSEKKSLGITHGIKVVAVEPESAAEKAGVRRNDAILSLNNQDILMPRDLISLVRKHKPGDKVTLILFRDGKEKKIAVHLQERKALGKDKPWHEMGGRKGFQMQPRPWLGIRLHAMNDELASYFQVTPEDGVLALETEKDGPAARGGLRAGDVIRQLDNERVRRPSDVTRILNELECGREVQVQVMRRGKTKTLTVTIGEAQWGKELRYHLFRKDKDEPGEGLSPFPQALRNLRFRLPRHVDEHMQLRVPRRLQRDWEERRIHKRRRASI